MRYKGLKGKCWELVRKIVKERDGDYRANLIRDYGEAVVADFERNWRKVNPVKNWDALIDSLARNS